MAIIDALKNQVGIQYFDTQIAPGINSPGEGSLITGPNDVLYLAWAQTSPNHSTRGIMFSKSTNKGVEWSAPVAITSGKWDDNPHIFFLTTDPASDIGLVYSGNEDHSGYDSGGYNRTTYSQAYRLTIDQNGVATSPTDLFTSGYVGETLLHLAWFLLAMATR